MEEVSFGEWLGRRRRSLDLTQKELARRMSCSPATIQKLESGMRRPSRQIAALLAEHLEIPAGQREAFVELARSRTLEHLPERLLAVAAEPAAAWHAPQAAPPARAHIPPGLPASPGPLIGRANELSQIAALLQGPEPSGCRLLTITGLGGVGKSRLALEVAARLEPAYHDGVYFISLAPLASPDLLASALASALGLALSSAGPPEDQVLRFLREKRLLLVMDNMEHLLPHDGQAGAPGAGLLHEILQAAPHARVLATSQERLRLQEEWVFELQGLPAPPEGETAGLEEYSAAALFLQHARQVDSRFQLDADSGPAVARICRMLGGMPLALQLAAGWLRTLSVEEIAAEIERSLDFLTASARDLPERQRSVRAVFDHSWRLLSEPEREILMRLSVFPGSFTREAAAQVAGAGLEALSFLVDKSLVRRAAGTGRASRYDLHELVRRYAAGRLQEDPTAQAAALERFTACYARLAAGWEAPLKSARQLEVMAETALEIDNLRQAWRLAVREPRLDLLFEMIPGVVWFAELHCLFQEGAEMMRTAVRRLRLLGAPESLSEGGDLLVYAFLLAELGWFTFRTGQTSRARAFLEESRELALPIDDPLVLFHIYHQLSTVALSMGRLETARRLNDGAGEYARRLGQPWHAASAMTAGGRIALESGDLEGAYERLGESLRLWRAVGDVRSLVYAQICLSEAALALGKTGEAMTLAGEASRLSEASRDRWSQASGLKLMGRAQLASGKPDEAAEYFRRAASTGREIGDRWATGQALTLLGRAALESGDAAAARAAFEQAVALALEAETTPVGLEALLGLAEVRVMDCCPQEAIEIAFFVAGHPSAGKDARDWAARMAAKLGRGLNAEQVEAARRKSAGGSLQDYLAPEDGSENVDAGL